MSTLLIQAMTSARWALHRVSGADFSGSHLRVRSIVSLRAIALGSWRAVGLSRVLGGPYCLHTNEERPERRKRPSLARPGAGVNMAHDEPAASGAPIKLAIKSVGLMLS